MTHVIKTGNFDKFLNKQFIFSNRTYAELVLVLSVMNLPFSQPTHKQSQSVGKEKEITAGYNMIVFTKEIKESVAKLRSDIMIKQRFYDPKDRRQYSDDDPLVFWEKDAE